MELITIDQIKWAIEKNKQGYTASEITDALYIHEKTLRRYMRKYGYMPRYNKVRPKLIYEKER